MTFSKQTIGVWIVLIAATTRASAQTTQPVPASWDEAVRGAAAALSSQPGASPLEAFCSDRLIVHGLNSSERSTREQLQQYCNNLSLVSARVYAWPTETVAVDLGADIMAFDPMPIALRRQYSPRNESDARRSNVIARQWINAVLQPSADSYVGVLVLWEAPPPIAASQLIGAPPISDLKPPVIVLLRGEKDESGGVRIMRIAFGSAKQALN
jgi:hypothetical protein